MNTATKVLVIDDEEVVRRSVDRALGNGCCKVEQACDGTVGIQALSREPFDVVLLDVRMPGSNGIEVLDQIKHRWPETEVVVITGYPAVETAKQAMRLGAYDYLAKPLGCDELAQVTHGAVQHKRWALRQAAND